jgi:uncharacterized protein YhdP
MTSAKSLPKLAAPFRSWPRLALLGLGAVAAIIVLILFAYELALARIPQHRAALERIVRAQTGLDVRFTELGLRWGWYGPEAVFRQVELDEPDSTEVLLRAPELVVGFDAWRTLRSGHPEAGRIELVAPEIDLSSAHGRRGLGAAGAGDGAGVGRGAVAGVPPSGTGAGVAAGAGAVGASSGESSVLGRVAVLQGWRGGRIDIEGGTLRLPDHGANSNLLTVQIRRASLRRSDDEWSVAGLVYLPDRVGRTARVTLRLNGDLAEPKTLGGSLQVEAKRLLFPGCRDFLAGLPDLARYLPRGGNSDVSFDVSFMHGQLVKVSGNVHAGGLLFDSLLGSHNSLALGGLRGEWRATRFAEGWRIHVKALDLDGFDLAGMQLEGTARGAELEWLPNRPAGERLQTRAKLENVALVPRSRDFTLSGLTAQLSGNETQLQVEVESRSARLELAQSQQEPLADIHVSSTLRVSDSPGGWQIATDQFLLEHQRASLRLSGTVQDDPVEPRIAASGTLTGADIPLVSRILGDNSAAAFGAIASRLTAGRIQNAEFALRGAIDKLLSEQGNEGFSGSLSLRDAVVSGGDLWPAATGVEARVEWHGARIQATITSGQAGPFQLATAKAQWDAAGGGATRLVGHVDGRLEEAIGWVRSHPELEQYAPEVRDVNVRGPAGFDLNVLIPAAAGAAPAPRSDQASGSQPVLARVSTFVHDATVEPISGLPPLEDLTGSFSFDSGRLQKSTLTGSWLGGPVTLRVGETREKGARVMTVQAQGTLSARQLATVANAVGTVEGSTDWAGELAYVPGESSHWRMRVDSNLAGLVSLLPAPFAKRPAALVPAHLEVTGGGDAAQLRTSLGDRMRGVFALQRRSDPGWVVERGAVRLGTATAMLPSEPVVLVRGHLNQFDLPAYALAWQRLRHDTLPAIRAQMITDDMLVAGHSYGQASLRVERTDRGTDLLLDSSQLAGMARWPAPHDLNSRRAATNGRGPASEPQPAELRLTRLDLPDEMIPAEAVGLLAALAPAAVVSVDDLTWRHRSLGRLTASATVDSEVAVIDDLRLVNGTQEASGLLRCQTALPMCRLTFTMDSSDAAATLTDFGFRADISAQAGVLKGDLQWQPAPGDQWLASLHGSLGMRLLHGTLRGWGQGEDLGVGTPAVQELRAAGRERFGLLAVPALVAAMDAREQRDLHFDRLEADFEVQNGQASTSNLHFDGDAEILMRGRTGLASRDYDQQVWVLRGEERLPAAVRRFGATPRVAAAWLSLRELFAGNGAPDRTPAVLRLQGSWDDPMVVPEN